VKHCDAIVLGPGLSLTEASIAFVVSVLDATDAETPLLIDADALNALAAVGERKPPVVSHEGTEPGEESINSVTQGLTRNLALESAGGLRVKPAMTGRGVINRRLPGSILTPHAGELDRLLKAFNCENAEALTQELCAIVVAKGPETRILSPDGRTLTNSNGTPALATAGTGDVLSGIIGSLLAQGLAPFEAATLGVELHAQAGKRAEQELGTRSVIATDLLAQLPQVLKGVSS
jgi:NAD(P)H-hydrate repair Nnr-like enzyme with NAD(P)H-hydrate dehydratase domain